MLVICLTASLLRWRAPCIPGQPEGAVTDERDVRSVVIRPDRRHLVPKDGWLSYSPTACGIYNRCERCDAWLRNKPPIGWAYRKRPKRMTGSGNMTLCADCAVEIGAVIGPPKVRPPKPKDTPP